MRGYDTHADKGICIDGVVRRPDVSWHRKGVEAPLQIFEIEYGRKSSIRKSWETLEKVSMDCNCRVVMIVPRDNEDLAKALQPNSLRDVMSLVVLLTTEECEECLAVSYGGLYELDTLLKDRS
ncbi:hypothetical protein [Haliangium sp.]|uniref:hypothetical protein n=1 Tax=Haliangium sp. TaxID=2663208 RepID=UPI003D12F121